MVGSLGGGVPAPVLLPTQPAPAATYGYNTLKLWDDFTSLSTIDVNNTLAPGFNWYIQNSQGKTYTQAPGCCKVDGTILTFTPKTNLGGWLCTCGWTGISPNYTVGNAIAPTGAYFEARMSSAGRDTNGPWWPAFWLYDNQITINIAAANNFPWNGNHYAEIDIMEKFGVDTTVLSTVWDWSGFTQPSTPIAAGTHFPASGTLNFADFHTYGCLWVPASKNGGTGLIQFFIDGVHQAGIDVTYSQTGASPEGNGTIGQFYCLDTSVLGYNLQIGSGAAWPILVDYVMVWQ